MLVCHHQSENGLQTQSYEIVEAKDQSVAFMVHTQGYLCAVCVCECVSECVSECGCVCVVEITFFISLINSEHVNTM